MKIVTAAEMGEIDRRTTEEFGVPSLTLMENAGSAVAEFCLHERPNAQTVGVICGKGNNGGDGFVAARKLSEAGKTVRVLLLADPSEVKGDAAEMLKRLPVQPVIARNVEQLERPEVAEVYEQELLIDAILGTGFKPPLSDLYQQAISQLRLIGLDDNGRELRRESIVIAVDIVSGIGSDAIDENANACHRADAVVTFTAFKPAQVFPTFPRTVLAQIGTPPHQVKSELGLNATTAAEVATYFMRYGRQEDAHKNQFGHVLLVGGSLGKSGAPAMAALAALRTGAGLVTVACPRSALPMIAGVAPEIMTEPLPETSQGTIALAALTSGRIAEVLKGKDTVAIGPGLSRHPETAEFIRELVSLCKLPIILDADGLNAFEGMATRLDGMLRPLVLTPHPGEFARLTGTHSGDLKSHSQRIEAARRLAAAAHCVVVLKGHRSLTAGPSRQVWVNTTGNAGMAKGGSGDVLTGIVAALVGRQVAFDRGPQFYTPLSTEEVQKTNASERFASTVADGVFLHGFAGDLAAERHGVEALLVTDLIKAMPSTFSRLQRAISRPPEIHWSFLSFASARERKAFGARWGDEWE